MLLFPFGHEGEAASDGELADIPSVNPERHRVEERLGDSGVESTDGEIVDRLLFGDFCGNERLSKKRGEEPREKGSHRAEFFLMPEIARRRRIGGKNDLVAEADLLDEREDRGPARRS